MKDLPYNLDAERAVIGACIRDNAAIATAAEYLMERSFYQPIYQKFWKYITDLSNDRDQVDFVTLGECLRKNNELNDTHINELRICVESVITSVNVEYHARIVADNATRRDIIRNCTETITKAKKDGEIDNLMAEALSQALKLQSPKKNKGLKSIQSCCDEALERIQERIKRKAEGISWRDIQTGIGGWDYKTGGVDAGDLVVIAARPSEGKTILGFQLAEHIGKTLPVAYFSLEMDAWRFVERFITGDANINSREGASILLRLAHELSQRNIYLDDTPGNTIENIHWQCMRLKLEHGKLGGIIIDYLTLLNTTKKFFGLREVITYLSNQTKCLAREMECPVFLLAQLNRESEKQKRKPAITDIRESGAVEQDADLIVLLHRDENVRRGETGPRELLFEKNRNGPTFTLPMIYSSAKRRFEDDEPPF